MKALTVFIFACYLFTITYSQNVTCDLPKAITPTGYASDSQNVQLILTGSIVYGFWKNAKIGDKALLTIGDWKDTNGALKVAIVVWENQRIDVKIGKSQKGVIIGGLKSGNFNETFLAQKDNANSNFKIKIMANVQVQQSQSIFFMIELATAGYNQVTGCQQTCSQGKGVEFLKRDNGTVELLYYTCWSKNLGISFLILAIAIIL